MAEQSNGLLSGEAESGVEVEEKVYGLVGFDLIFPAKGRSLGLDISKNSTGFTIVEDQGISWENIKLETNIGSVHGEALMRREFRERLSEYIQGMHFDAVVVEDVFSGSQVHGVRSLYALNTVIDDMILDGDITVSEGGFHRVQNTMWKSWLRVLDPERVGRYHNDKQMIAGLLKAVGVSAEGKGAQDRLDSLGMLTGYYIMKSGIAGAGVNAKVKVSAEYKIRDVEAVYFGTKEELDAQVEAFEGPVEKYNMKVTQKGILESLTERPEYAFYCPQKVSLGLIATKLGLKSYPFGGYFMFWLK